MLSLSQIAEKELEEQKQIFNICDYYAKMPPCGLHRFRIDNGICDLNGTRRHVTVYIRWSGVDHLPQKTARMNPKI